MLWIFARGVQQLHVETRLDGTECHFVMRILWPDGREQVEAFSAEGPFHRRLVELELELREQNWMRPAGPILDTPVEMKLLASPAERRGATDRRRLTRQERRSGKRKTAKHQESPTVDAQKDEDA
jgi:hypothetical protein